MASTRRLPISSLKSHQPSLSHQGPVPITSRDGGISRVEEGPGTLSGDFSSRRQQPASPSQAELRVQHLAQPRATPRVLLHACYYLPGRIVQNGQQRHAFTGMARARKLLVTKHIMVFCGTTSGPMPWLPWLMERLWSGPDTVHFINTEVVPPLWSIRPRNKVRSYVVLLGLHTISEWVT